MASHFQEDLIASKGDDMGPVGNTTHVQPKGVGASQGPLGAENASGSSEMVERGVNPVLENDAQTKGKWFAYVKTKQFWVAMLLGQGTFCTIRGLWASKDESEMVADRGSF